MRERRRRLNGIRAGRSKHSDPGYSGGQRRVRAIEGFFSPGTSSRTIHPLGPGGQGALRCEGVVEEPVRHVMIEVDSAPLEFASSRGSSSAAIIAGSTTIVLATCAVVVEQPDVALWRIRS
jgi:hypothetical protein